jgi:hypothetical protein
MTQRVLWHLAKISRFNFQTATPSHSRGAMRPSFASPSRDQRKGWSDGRRQGCCVRHPLEADQWTHLARQGDRARPRLGAAPPSAPPYHQAVNRSGAPRSGQLALCPLQGSLLESAPHRTGQEQDKRGSGDGDKECEKKFSSAITGTCPGRGAAFFMPLRRAGTVPNTGAWYDPGSAKQRFARATRCIASGTRCQLIR